MRFGRLAAPFTAALIAAASFSTLPVAAAQRFGVGDLPHVVALSSPALSPDGKRVAIVVTRVNMTEDGYDRDLDLIDVTTHARRTLTYKRKGLSDPAWSPSGNRLAFIASDGTGEEAKSQVFVMPMDGGDARPVTSAPDGVDQFAWRPDGNGFAYAASDPEPKRKGQDKYRDSFVVGNNPITAHAIFQPSRLYVQPIDGKAKRLTSGAGSVATGEAQSTLSWSPDGKTIAFVLAPNAVLNDNVRAHAMIVDVATGAMHALTTNRTYEADPRFSPDGKHIVYVHSLGDSQITLSEAYVTTPGGGNGAPVSRAYDRAVAQTAWSPASDALYFSCNDGTRVTVVRTPLDGAPKRVDLGDLNISSELDGALGANGAIAFVGSSAMHPGELYYKASSDAAPVALTDYNAAIVARSLGDAETITFQTSNGMTSDAVLTKPPGFTAGAHYPLVVYIHGGPTAASVTSFDRMAQLMAARGWLVLEPNYRGSDNHGLAFQRAVRYDAEEGPGKDIMAALDAVRARGIVDEKRIAVSGWSYGGIMTAWMITHYHVWKAAVSGASVNDWKTDYSVSDDSESDAALFHGSPWMAANRAEYERVSAVNYAAQVTTPVLLLHDVGDNRDAITNSYEFYHALKDHGKDVTFVAWPVNGHFPHDPIRTFDVYSQWITYIARHF